MHIYDSVDLHHPQGDVHHPGEGGLALFRRSGFAGEEVVGDGEEGQGALVGLRVVGIEDIGGKHIPHLIAVSQRFADFHRLHQEPEVGIAVIYQYSGIEKSYLIPFEHPNPGQCPGWN